MTIRETCKVLDLPATTSKQRQSQLAYPTTRRHGDGGDYEVISGSGAFEDATETGRFDGVENSWENANLCDGTITVMKK